MSRSLVPARRRSLRLLSLTVALAATTAASVASAQSWEFVDGPPISCVDLRFYDGQSALMQGTVHLEDGNIEGLSRTTDGGESWVAVNGPADFSLSQVVFLGSQIMIATGLDQSGRPQDWGFGITRSDDGGATWEPLVDPSGGSGKIYFDDPDNGTIVAPNDGGIWSTTDGGRSWTEGGTAPADYEDAVRAAWADAPGSSGFFAPSAEIVRGDRAVYGAGDRVGTTVDAGAAWAFFELPQHSNGERPSQLQSADFASDDVVYAFAERAPQNPIPYHTTDGGVTWAPSGFERPADAGFNTDARCIQALAVGLVYAASDQSSFDPQPMMRLGDPSRVDVPDLDPWAEPVAPGDDVGTSDTGTTDAGGSDTGVSDVGSGDGSDPSDASTAGSGGGTSGGDGGGGCSTTSGLRGAGWLCVLAALAALPRRRRPALR